MSETAELTRARAELALMRMALTSVQHDPKFNQLNAELVEHINQVLNCRDVGRHTLIFWRLLATENVKLRKQLQKTDGMDVQEGRDSPVGDGCLQPDVARGAGV